METQPLGEPEYLGKAKVNGDMLKITHIQALGEYFNTLGDEGRGPLMHLLQGENNLLLFGKPVEALASFIQVRNAIPENEETLKEHATALVEAASKCVKVSGAAEQHSFSSFNSGPDGSGSAVVAITKAGSIQFANIPMTFKAMGNILEIRSSIPRQYIQLICAAAVAMGKAKNNALEDYRYLESPSGK